MDLRDYQYDILRDIGENDRLLLMCARQIGATSICMLSMLSEMIEGRKVRYVVHNHSMARHFKRRFKEYVDNYNTTLSALDIRPSANIEDVVVVPRQSLEANGDHFVTTYYDLSGVSDITIEELGLFSSNRVVIISSFVNPTIFAELGFTIKQYSWDVVHGRDDIWHTEMSRAIGESAFNFEHGFGSDTDAFLKAKSQVRLDSDIFEV